MALSGTKRATLAASILGSGMAFIDMSAVNVLLPILQDAFDTGITSVQWVVEAFTLFLAALLLVGGALGDRYGRRRIFMWGIGVFVVASVAVGLAPSIGFLIAARALQGIGGALLVPGSLALITDAFEPHERASAFGIWAAMSGFTAAGGPLIAGFLADYASWRVVFLINVPLGALNMWFLTRVPESRVDPDARLDVVGSVLATVGLGAFTFGFVEANARGLDAPIVIGSIALGVLALVGFLVAESRVKHPMVPLDMFRDRTFAGMNVATLFIYAALSGALFFVPFNLIQLQGWSATAAGASLMPFAVLITVLSEPSGRLADRVGPRIPLAVGGALASLGLLILAIPGRDASYWTTFFPAFVLLGVGMSGVVPALTASVMNAAPTKRAGVASGINNAVARAAGLLAIAVLGLVAVQTFAGALPADVRAAVGDDAQNLAETVPPEGTPQSVIDDAFVRAYRTVTTAGFALAAIGTAVGAWAAPGRGRAQSG